MSPDLGSLGCESDDPRNSGTYQVLTATLHLHIQITSPKQHPGDLADLEFALG